MQMTERFEGQIIGYMFNQARMSFFVCGSYPHYKVENGRLVQDNGQESKSLREEANDLYELLNQVESRIKRDMRVPATWVRSLTQATSLVLAMRECRVTSEEWANEFHRAVRFVQQYQAH